MKDVLIFLTMVGWSTGFVIPGKNGDDRDPVSPVMIPDKLLRYQNVTGIDDSTLLKMLNDSLQGKRLLQ